MSVCLVALGVWDARPAWATCGDYLTGHGGHAMVGHEMADHDFPKPHSSPAQQPRPACSGPNCHQRDPVPMAPTRQVHVSPSNDAMLSALFSTTDDIGRSFLRAMVVDHIIEGPTTRLFRPPRTV